MPDPHAPSRPATPALAAVPIRGTAPLAEVPFRATAPLAEVPFRGTAPLAPGPPPDRPGFGAGVGALFSGIGFVVGTPAAWPLALVPMVILLALTAIVGVSGYEALSPRVVGLLGPWAQSAHGALAIVAKVLVGVLSLVIGLALGTVLAQPLSSPALGRIVRRVEAGLGLAPWPAVTLATDVGRSIESLILTTALATPLFVLIVLVDLIFPPAVIVTTPIKVALTALTCAWDLCDYPLSAHGWPIRPRVALLRRHLGAVMGFGLGLGLLSLVPCALLLVLPAGVAGATRLVARIEAWEKASGIAGKPPVS